MAGREEEPVASSSSPIPPSSPLAANATPAFPIRSDINDKVCLTSVHTLHLAADVAGCPMNETRAESICPFTRSLLQADRHGVLLDAFFNGDRCFTGEVRAVPSPGLVGYK
mmetsp:Transcript_42538/g.109356  ORF Transcript_42538/g.109356 Transcript_42538/m.109356 type:complete len:111 (-) Transcript_42538:48-380(-)